jgi:hypothetical protein
MNAIRRSVSSTFYFTTISLICVLVVMAPVAAMVLGSGAMSVDTYLILIGVFLSRSLAVGFVGARALQGLDHQAVLRIVGMHSVRILGLFVGSVLGMRYLRSVGAVVGAIAFFLLFRSLGAVVAKEAARVLDRHIELRKPQVDGQLAIPALTILLRISLLGAPILMLAIGLALNYLRIEVSFPVQVRPSVDFMVIICSIIFALLPLFIKQPLRERLQGRRRFFGGSYSHAFLYISAACGMMPSVYGLMLFLIGGRMTTLALSTLASLILIGFLSIELEGSHMEAG